MRIRAITERATRTAGLSMVLLVTLAVSAAAQHSAGAVEVRINSVLASDTNKGCDASLRALQRHLERLFHFTTYHLVSHQDRQTRFGQLVEFDLPGGRILQIEPIDRAGDMINVEVTLFEGDQPLMTTDFKIISGGVLLVGGPRYEQGALIISIEPLAVDEPSIPTQPVARPAN